MTRDVVIAGVYATTQGRDLNTTPVALSLEAATGALADAGMSWADVDGLALDWNAPAGEQLETGTWAPYTGGSLRWTSDGMLDNAGVRGMLKAAAAISAGLCDVAVVGGGMSGVFKAGGAIAAPPLDFVDLYGGYVVPLFALVAQAHMDLYGTSPEQLAAVAATIRNNASTNPEAVTFGKGPYTVADVLDSPMVSTPFHLLDVCIRAEGGAAMVLTTAEIAAAHDCRPVRILGGGLEVAGAAYAAPPTWEVAGRLGEAAAHRALAQAGLGSGDVDVFSLYDPTSFEVIRQVELLGLCGPGEGGAFVESGAIGLDGSSPVNPDGGCLGYAWNGTQQLTLRVIEGVRQLRGTAVHQVADVEAVLVANAGSAALHYEVAVLG